MTIANSRHSICFKKKKKEISSSIVFGKTRQEMAAP